VHGDGEHVADSVTTAVVRAPRTMPDPSSWGWRAGSARTRSTASGGAAMRRDTDTGRPDRWRASRPATPRSRDRGSATVESSAGVHQRCSSKTERSSSVQPSLATAKRSPRTTVVLDAVDHLAVELGHGGRWMTGPSCSSTSPLLGPPGGLGRRFSRLHHRRAGTTRNRPRAGRSPPRIEQYGTVGATGAPSRPVAGQPADTDRIAAASAAAEPV
jgi:hypothetical protein